MAYTIKAVADLAGVTVRTLHHYDHIGLLKPSSVSPAGYRLYSDGDLERLQQVLFFRELGFGLDEIAAVVNRPAFDRRAALTSHRKLLVEKQRRLTALITSVDRTLDNLERGIPMDTTTLFDGFDESTLKAYQDEARQRWGNDRVDESIRRTKQYTKEDWATIRAETDAINSGLAALMDGDPAAPAAQALVERWFRLINDRYYTCPLELFRGLGDLYVDDPRFTASYDKVRPGLAAFLKAAMHHYCDTATV